MQSKKETQTQDTSLQVQWRANSERALSLSKKIIQGTAQIAQIEMGLTIADTLSKKTIRSEFKGNDGVAYSAVYTLVNRFINSFAFSTKISKDQIESLTIDTLEHFAYESMEDIILFFKMSRTGKLGTAKRGIDASIIFGEWFPKYLELKATEREQLRTEEKKSHINNETSIADVQKTYAKARDKTKLQKVKDYIEKITSDMDRQLLEDTIIEWEKCPKRKPYLRHLKAKRRTIK